MAEQFTISSEEGKKARIPHDILLINLIFNHILVFVACLTASVLIEYIVVVPVLSAILLVSIFIGAHRAKSSSSWYVSGHWQLCAKRSLIFLLMIMTLCSLFALLYWISDGNLRPQHWAIGGAAGLPVMVTVLALIVMESEALHHAKTGLLPDWIRKKYPHNSLVPVVDETMNHQDEEIVQT